MPKITNGSTVPALVGGRLILPGHSFQIPENHWQGWLMMSEANQAFANEHLLIDASSAKGAEEPPQPPPLPPLEQPAPQAPPMAPATFDPGKIDAALAAFDHADDASWTEDGQPRVEALQKATGYRTLRSSDRDAAVERTGITRSPAMK